MTKTQFCLLAFMAMFCTACAGMTAAETTGAIGATTGVLVALSEAIIPYLPAAKQAEVVAAMNSAQGLMNAVTTAMGSVAQSAAEAQRQAAEGVSTEGLIAGGSAAAALAVGTSRAMSASKHGYIGKQKHQG